MVGTITLRDGYETMFCMECLALIPLYLVRTGGAILSDFEPGVDELWFLNDNLEVDNSIAKCSTNSDGFAI